MLTLRAVDAEGWTRVCSDTFVSIETSTTARFTGRIDHVGVSWAGFSEVDCGPCDVSRTARSIRGDLRDDFLVNIVQEGAGTVSVPGATLALSKGSVALCDAGHAFSLGFVEAATVLTLRLPRSAMPVLAHHPVMRPRIVGAGVGSATILRHFVSGVLKVAQSGKVVVDDIAGTAADLLLIALDESGISSADLGRFVDRNARYVIIREYLDRRYADPGLTIEQVARRHGVSRRHIEELFARHGQSPGTYLRSIRLSRARTLLEAADRPLPIADIALRTGFSDPATFTRAFRRAHGVTPNAWRRDHGRHDRLLPRPG